jgi:predicted transposase YdaD
MILRTLKAERSGDLLADPVWDESLLDRLPRLIFEMLLSYILRADIDKDDFDNKIKLFQKAETRTTAMSLAEQLRQEGRQEGHLAGRQEGRREGRQEAVLSNLQIRFGPVPHGLVEAMRQVTDPTHLESLQRVSFTCASIEEFAAAL